MNAPTTSEPQNPAPSNHGRLRSFLKSAGPFCLVTLGGFLFVLFALEMTPPAQSQMPYHQILDVQCKLGEHGVSSSQYQVLTIPGSHEHAFQYWRSPDGNGTNRTATDVINFLDTYLK